MFPIKIGTDVETNLAYHLDPELLRTHLHAIGATGSGKTTLILSIIKSLLSDPRPKCALFLIDPVGNLSQNLLTWIADPKTCPNHVRDRLLYVEPANQRWVLPFNPLHSHQQETDEQLYFQAGRSMEIVLRGWASQNADQMPRLKYWTFACFFALAAMGLPIAASRWLLRPGTKEHAALLAQLPTHLRAMWAEILKGGSEALRQLESTRSRLALFADCGILRRMFGVTENRFDVSKFIEGRKVVIVNLGSSDTLDPQIARTIGGFVVNEVIQTAMGMTPKQVDPTYLILDEFQHFVGPDLFNALPLVRQLGLRLILAHQSFSQLVRGDIDLTSIIWQARSRLMFSNAAEDATIIAEELAKMSHDPYLLKEVRHTPRQLIVGHRRETTRSTSATRTDSTAKDVGAGHTTGKNAGTSHAPGETQFTRSSGGQSSTSRSESEKTAHSNGESHTVGEVLVPIHDTYDDVTNTYFSFQEQQLKWERLVRELPTGFAFGKFKDDPKLYHLQIEEQKTDETPELRQRKQELLAKNFESEFFVSKEAIEREEERLRLSLLSQTAIVIPSNFAANLTLPTLPLTTSSDVVPNSKASDQTAPPPSPSAPPQNRFL